MERNDEMVKVDGMKALIDALGLFDAGRFVSLMLREPSNYTEWRQTHLVDDEIRIRELSNRAMKAIPGAVPSEENRGV